MGRCICTITILVLRALHIAHYKTICTGCITSHLLAIRGGQSSSYVKESHLNLQVATLRGISLKPLKKRLSPLDPSRHIEHQIHLASALNVVLTFPDEVTGFTHGTQLLSDIEVDIRIVLEVVKLQVVIQLLDLILR